LRLHNDQNGTGFEHSVVELRKWFLVVYTYIRFNTGLQQLGVEIGVAYKMVFQRFLRALDAS
jgi:transposase-like protein